MGHGFVPSAPLSLSSGPTACPFCVALVMLDMTELVAVISCPQPLGLVLTLWTGAEAFDPLPISAKCK